jgi:2-phospho-L-lactate guanylyltransferase
MAFAERCCKADAVTKRPRPDSSLGPHPDSPFGESTPPVGESTPPVGESTPPLAVLVPVKRFADAKARLAGALPPLERAALAQAMATTVVAAAAPLSVWVVCDDPSVAAWATDLGAQVLWRPGRGLNGAVTEGARALAALGVERVIVSHADLPHARRLAWVAQFGGVTIVPDRRDDGTNVICVPTGADFHFAYGAGSFRRHSAEARRLGLAVRVVREPSLGWDVDLPDDLGALATVGPWTSPASPL